MCHDNKRAKNTHGAASEGYDHADQGQGYHGKGVKFAKSNTNPGRGGKRFNYPQGKYEPPTNQGEDVVPDDITHTFDVDPPVDVIPFKLQIQSLPL